MVESSSFAGHMANVILGLVLLLIAFCSIVLCNVKCLSERTVESLPL